VNLELPCEKCNSLLGVPDDFLGKQVQCGACGCVQTARLPPSSAIRPDQPVTLKPADERGSDTERRITGEVRRPVDPALSRPRRYEEEGYDLRSRPIDCPYCQKRIALRKEPCPGCGCNVDFNSVEDELARLRKERSLQNTLSIAFGLPGFALASVSSPVIDALKQGGAVIGTLAFAIVVLGVALFLVGGIFYAKYKGQQPAFGLFILLGCIGLIVLLCLSDRKGKQIGRLKNYLDDY
jgi:hypothetical protein